MRKALSVLIFSFIVSSALAQDTAKVYSGVTQYFRSLMTDPVDTIIARVDTLIEKTAVQGAEAQSSVAGLAFDFFNNSPLMGQEAVAVHIADNYFLNKRLKWSDESTFPNLYAFAEFNRSSLVGMPASELRMEGIDSLWVSMRNYSSPYKLLYFYEPQCATCRKETPALKSFAENYHGPHIAIFAIYTQSDRESWNRYVAENFASVDNPDVTFIHLWDPEMESDFQKKYGVLTTPAMFLLDDQNRITGRKLDCKALSDMLAFKSVEGNQYKLLFDRIFESLRPLDFNDAGIVAEAVAKKTKRDSSLFRETVYNLYQYFRNSEEAELQEGAMYVAEHFIAGCPEYWSKEYVREVIHQVQMAKVNQIGDYAPDLLLSDRKGRVKHLLDCKLEYHLILFHLVNCKECMQEIEQLKRMNYDLSDSGISVTLVYVGIDYDGWKAFTKKVPVHWRCLWDADGKSGMNELYDIEEVPRAFLLDGSDRIIGKHFKMNALKDIIQIL